MAPRIASTYKDKPFEERSASFIAATNIAKREYQKDYLDYWNSTAAITGTGRPVDAIIMPIAAVAAVRPNFHKFHGKLFKVDGMDLGYYLALTISSLHLYY